MASRKKLTWDSARKRWKKIYKGRQIYLGSGGSKSDEASYRLALEQFEIKRAEIDKEADRHKPHKEDYDLAITLRDEMARWCLLEGEHAEHDRLTQEINWLVEHFARVNPPPLNEPNTLWIDPLYGKPAAEKMLWMDRVAALETYEKWTGPRDPEKTLEAAVKKYLDGRRAEATAGQISPQRYKRCSEWLGVFQKCMGGDIAIDKLTAKQLDGFYRHLLEQVEKGKYSPAYAKSILGDVKGFVRWLWRQEVIEQLPRNLEDLTIELGQEQVETLTIEEVKRILARAKGKTRLYICLALNCGMTQKDIGDLKPEEVDWEHGRITRKRSKTRKQRTVPTVKYKLWNETFKLLREFGHQEGSHVLLNSRGNPVRDMGFKDGDTKLKTNDSVRKAMVALCDGEDIDRPQFKAFRSTSSTMLFNNRTYRGLHQLFLGQSGKTVAERHYINPDETILDEALDWLAEQYGVK